MTTDPLNAIQQVGQQAAGIGAGVLVPTAGGVKHWLQPRNKSGIYNGHSIDSIIDALTQPTMLQQVWNIVKQAITPPSFH